MGDSCSLMFRVDPELMRLFRVALAVDGVSAQKVLEEAVQEYVKKSGVSEMLRDRI